jgi:hypothetical protein
LKTVQNIGFFIPTSTYSEKKKNRTPNYLFLPFVCPKTYFRIGKQENKETRIFYIDFRILLPIQIQLLGIENLKKIVKVANI